MLLLPIAAALALYAGTPEAIAYLKAEVPRWKAENGCYSCHNNGDGARALLAAGVAATDPALTDTLSFLRDVKRWPGDLAPLALVQYTIALQASGADARAAAQRLAAHQKADGHWEMDAESQTGSPVTYGPVLGTVLARQALAKAGGFEPVIAKADAWLEARKVEHPMDIAAIVMAFRREVDIAKLKSMQAADGSFNGGEAFDTAIASIALGGDAKARQWLLKNQLQPGGWRGTTRPAGGGSYAQHISTTAWALLALMEVDR